jgi:hypothetical protein
MAKTTAPLLSFDAGGQIAKTQVYSRWKGRSYVRRYTVPANPDTAGQKLTRNTFAWLNQVWKYFPGSAVAAWQLYADNNRITDRNAWIKQNLSQLRPETTITDIVLSPAAGGGIAAEGMSLTAGSESIAVALTAPTLPTGWTIVSAFAAAIRNQDPQTEGFYVVTAGSDNSTPYEITLTGLTATEEYVVGGWFQFLKPDGSNAYGVALQDTATPTA